MEAYYKSALEAEKKIAELEAKLTKLEALKAGKTVPSSSEKGSEGSSTSSSTTPTPSVVTYLHFQTAQDAKDFVERNEKWWIFGKTWQARFEDNKIAVAHYSPLSDKEFEDFTKGREAVPRQICRFDQYYAKQLAAMVKEYSITFSHEKVQEKILPKKGQRNILITSALPYVNNTPHLGNIVGCVLSADVFSRFCRARGYNSLFVCGTDEYGTATETKAVQEGMTPKEICDKYNAIHKKVYDWFDIGFDHFGRTSTEVQTKITQDIFWKLHKNGFINEDSMDQLFCQKCSRFLADRYVEGTCNLCGFEDARGDQCDKCGHLLNATELIKPRCKLCNSTPIVRSSKHLFLDLTKLTDQLQVWVADASVKGNWDANAVQTTLSWIKEGLKPRCITRDLKWGTPVPLKGYEDKVFYVWFDAPIGYLSITGCAVAEWEEWWKNPNDVQLYQFMGKDNVPFHTVMFPSSLLGTGDPYTLLHHISTTEYLNYEGGKFSKSRGTGVFGTDAIDTGIPSEVWRYYLLINRPETSDSSFTWSDFLSKNNSELIGNLGNFVNRPLSFAAKEFQGVIPPLQGLEEIDRELIANVNKELTNYIKALDAVQIKNGLKSACAISFLGNTYLQTTEPWKLSSTNRGRCGTIINLALNLAKLLGTVFEPFMPGFSRKLFDQLKCEKGPIPDSWTLELKEGHKIGTPQVIFRKLTEEEIENLAGKYGGKPTTAFPLDIRGGEIKSVDNHPQDGELYVLSVNVGENKPRQVVGRLKTLHPNQKDLIGKQVLVLCNLPVAELKGVKSEGMILIADSKKESAILGPLGSPSSNWVGAQLIPQGTSFQNPEPVQLKEFQKMDLKVVEGKVLWKQKQPLTPSSDQKLFVGVKNIQSAKIK